MDKMRQEVEGKLHSWRRLCVMFAILTIANVLYYEAQINVSSAYADSIRGFANGFQMGISTGITLLAVIQVVKYRKILKSEETIRNEYIKEHDERNAAIWAKSGGTVLYKCAVFIIGAAVVAGYFDMTVFVTLLVCGIFLLLVKKTLLIYYRKTL